VNSLKHSVRVCGAAATVLILGLTSTARSSEVSASPARQPSLSEPLQLPEVRIIQQSAGSVELEIRFPEIEAFDAPAGKFVRMGRLHGKPDAEGYVLPVYQFVLPGEVTDYSLHPQEVKTSILPLDQPPARYLRDYRNEETASHDGRTPGIAYMSAARKNKTGYSDWVTLRAIGSAQRSPICALELQAARWDARRGDLVYLRSMTLRLNFQIRTSPGRRPVPLPAALRQRTLPIAIPAASRLPEPRPPVSQSAAQTRLKIYVSQDGIYHLDSGYLGGAGVPLSGVDPRTLRLENRGGEVPIYVAGEADGRFDDGDYIEFWGEKLHGTYTGLNPEIYSDPYSDVNVYWLSWGGALGARLVEESGEIVEVNELKMFRATSYPYWVHIEQNNYYNRLSQVDPDSLKEHWYFDGGIKASETRDYSVYLPHPDNNALSNTRVRVALQGLTYADAFNQGGQHHAYVSLNDQNSPALEAGSSGASWWVNQTGVILDTQGNQGISSAVLNHGNNHLSIFVPVDTDAGPNDTILLNWFEITYPRLYKADADWIRFSPPSAAVDTLVDYRIEGFTTSQIDVFKLGQSKVINVEILPYQVGGATRYKLHFQDRPYGAPQYVALTPGAKLFPDSTKLDEGSDIQGTLSSGPAVKLLVVANRIFSQNPDLQEYLQRRQTNLGRTELVFIDDVFDEYSQGIYDPQAIKTMLQAMPEPPDYLLLVGDASYDTRNIYGKGGNLLPAHYIQTKAYGAVASDFWYGLLDGDLIPDVAVGRISCRSDEELSGYLSKLKEYEVNPEPGDWHAKHLFVSGTGGVDWLTFLNLSQTIIGYISNDVFVERLATEPISSPFYGGTTDLLDLFDAGAEVVVYNGHGAGAVWSDNSLFRLENLPQLSNRGKYPFVTNFTCFIGAFDTPEQGTILGEEFLFEPQKGAVAVLGSTGLGWFINGSWLQEQLMEILYQQPEMSLGELINAAKTLYYSYYGQGQSEESYDTIHLMNLLGDPSMRLSFAAVAAPAAATPQFTTGGDSVHVNLTGDYSGFEGILRFYDQDDYPILQYGQPYEIPLVTSSQGVRADFLMPQIPDTSNAAEGTFRMTFWDPSGTAAYKSTAAFFSSSAFADSAVADSLAPYPEPVYLSDPFGFRARVLDPEGVESVYVHFHIETNEGEPLVDHDSLLMSSSGQSYWYQTEAVVDTATYPYGVGDRVIAWVKVLDQQGDTARSTEKIFYILDDRPNPTWVSGSFRMDARENQAALIVEVENQGKTGIDSMDVGFYLAEPVWQYLGGAVLRNLDPDSTKEAFLPVSLPPGLHEFEIRMNEQGWIATTDSASAYGASLIVDHFTVTRAEGSGDTLNLGDVFRVYLPDSSISGASGVLIFRERQDLQIPTSQEGLSFALEDSAGVVPGWGVEVGLTGGVSLINNALYLAVDLTSHIAQPSSEIALHRQEAGGIYWQLIGGSVDTLALNPYPLFRYSALTNSPGVFTLLQNGDHQGPKIEISVEGQIYTDGGYVSTQPKISAVVQDPGGVNTASGTYWLSIDGVTEDTSRIALHVEGSGQVMTLSVNPTFAVGSHTLSVVAQDLSGNIGTTTINFQVTGQFRLDFLGNYPNPLKDKTYFAYRLTEQTTEPVQIRIYTVSGRLIRTLYSSSGEEINYGEIYWDGRDEDGANIANGVYFYKFKARRGDTIIERTMKLAKLR
jgi:hypothetical protein